MGRVGGICAKRGGRLETQSQGWHGSPPVVIYGVGRNQTNVVLENAGALMGQKSLSMNLNVPTIPIIAALSVV